MLITYTCIFSILKAYDITGSSVNRDYDEFLSVYPAPGRDYNAHRIM
jgi:hypothetical protein